MEIKILTPNFKLLYVLDGATSLSYTESFQDAGELQMTLPYTASLYKMLLPSNRLLVEDLIYTIEKTELENGEIKVRALGLFDHFSHMYIGTPTYMSSTPATLVAQLASVADFEGVNYTYYGLTLRENPIMVMEWFVDYKSVLTKIFKKYALGYRMSYDYASGELAFRLLQVFDKAYNEQNRVIVSDQRDCYELLGCIKDMDNYKNKIEIFQWSATIGDYISKTYDKSGSEPKRTLSYLASVPAENEAELIAGFDTIADNLFAKHQKRELYKIRMLTDMGIRVGDVCAFECRLMDAPMGAYVSDRYVNYKNGKREEILIMEIEQ